MDKREEPLDCVDALLFWVNKICLLVRDDVERQGIQLKGADNDAEPTIPEMEDLYSDLCDGTCISAVVAFYRPHEVDLRGERADGCLQELFRLQTSTSTIPFPSPIVATIWAF